MGEKIECLRGGIGWLVARNKSIMASFFNQESSEEIGSAMFSYTSHTSGKREERRKTDRKAGKERRKAQKTLGSMIAKMKLLDYKSVPTIWCIGKNGHWGSPVLNDKGCLVIQNYCADCKHFDDERIKRLKSPEGIAWSEENNALFYYDSEWEADVIEAMEEQRVRNEQKWLRIAALESLLRKMEASTVNADPDDFIPEIDDDYDY